MGLQVILLLLLPLTAVIAWIGGWSVYRLLDGDSQYDVRQWFMHQVNRVIPFYSAFQYRLRFWWRHKIRGKPIPEPYDGPMPNYVSELFKMSPTDSPFLSMIGKDKKELTAGDYEPEDDDG